MTLDVGEKVTLKLMLHDVLVAVCEVRSSPDRIMAFLLNKIMSASGSSLNFAGQRNAQGNTRKEKGFNGKPGELKKMLYEKSLEQVFYEVKRQFSYLVQEENVDDALRPLWDIVEPVKGELFLLDVRKITDTTNFITGKMKERKGELL